MEHDVPLRAAARAIYETCFYADLLTGLAFEQAERRRTSLYLHAVEAAQSARLTSRIDTRKQLQLI